MKGNGDKDCVEISGDYVLELVLQFLEESGLTATATTLISEAHLTRTSLPASALSSLESSLLSGAWDSVLPQISHLSLPSSVSTAIYQQAFLELCALNQFPAARALLAAFPASLSPLSPALNSPPSLPSLVSRRPSLASSVKSALSSSSSSSSLPPGQLLTLLASARPDLKPELSLVSSLPSNKPLETANEYKGEARELVGESSLGRSGHAECAVFFPEGDNVAVGCWDGLCENWDASKGERAGEEENAVLIPEGHVLAVSVSNDGSSVVTGDSGGVVSVWEAQTGKRIALGTSGVHAGGVTCVALGGRGGGSSVASGGADGTVRVQGLASGRTLLVMRGHVGAVNSVCWGEGGRVIVSGASDGTVAVWDAGSGQRLGMFVPGAKDEGKEEQDVELGKRIPVMYVREAQTQGSGVYFVGLREGKSFLVSKNGDTVRMFQPPEGKSLKCYVGWGLGPNESKVYCGREDGIVEVYRTRTGQLEQCLTLTGPGKLLGLAVSPTKQQIVTWTEEGSLRFWGPYKAKNKDKNEKEPNQAVSFSFN